MLSILIFVWVFIVFRSGLIIWLVREVKELLYWVIDFCYVLYLNFLNFLIELFILVISY